MESKAGAGSSEQGGLTTRTNRGRTTMLSPETKNAPRLSVHAFVFLESQALLDFTRPNMMELF